MGNFLAIIKLRMDLNQSFQEFICDSKNIIYIYIYWNLAYLELGNPNPIGICADIMSFEYAQILAPEWKKKIKNISSSDHVFKYVYVLFTCKVSTKIITVKLILN